MPVNIEQWPASIGLIQPILGLQAASGFKDLRLVNYKVIVFFVLLLLSRGDTEVKPGPKRKLSKLSCCHLNVNSILSHNKMSLIIECNTVQKFDVTCISETYLDNHPDNLKKGGVCLNHK